MYPVVPISHRIMVGQGSCRHLRNAAHTQKHNRPSCLLLLVSTAADQEGAYYQSPQVTNATVHLVACGGFGALIDCCSHRTKTFAWMPTFPFQPPLSGVLPGMCWLERVFFWSCASCRLASDAWPRAWRDYVCLCTCGHSTSSDRASLRCELIGAPSGCRDVRIESRSAGTRTASRRCGSSDAPAAPLSMTCENCIRVPGTQSTSPSGVSLVRADPHETCGTPRRGSGGTCAA